MDKKGPDPRRFPERVQVPRLPARLAIPPEKGLTKTPSPASDYLVLLHHHEISAVLDEFPIHSPGGPKRGLDLGFRIVRASQLSRGQTNEFFQGGYVIEGRHAGGEIHFSLLNNYS